MWHAIDRATNNVIASVFGPHTDEVFEQLYTLLELFQIGHYYTDGWETYTKYLPKDKHTVRKKETQRIERKH